MTVQNQEDIQGLKEIGRVIALTIKEMKDCARVGMTTRELDEIGGQVLKKHGAKSAPKTTYGFPGETCISINHVVAHGIPGDRIIQAGDLVNVDVSAELGGYYADAGHSFTMPPHDPALSRLCEYTYSTMMKIISSLKHGVRLNEIGRMIQTEAAKGGYKAVKNLCSHGIGKSLHEAPKEILPFYNKHDHRVLKEGQVITIEPFLSTGAEYVEEHSDGWTLFVPDNSYVAQHEHTIIITRDQPVIVTVA